MAGENGLGDEKRAKKYFKIFFGKAKRVSTFAVPKRRELKSEKAGSESQ